LRAQSVANTGISANMKKKDKELFLQRVEEEFNKGLAAAAAAAAECVATARSWWLGGCAMALLVDAFALRAGRLRARRATRTCVPATRRPNSAAPLPTRQ
jgi:hypothetical protein